jgi:hypothetical protein
VPIVGATCAIRITLTVVQQANENGDLALIGHAFKAQVSAWSANAITTACTLVLLSAAVTVIARAGNNLVRAAHCRVASVAGTLVAIIAVRWSTCANTLHTGIRQRARVPVITEDLVVNEYASLECITGIVRAGVVVVAG